MYENIKAITSFMASIMLAKFAFNDVPHAAGLVKGTCYQDAWRYLIRQEAGTLVHGSIIGADGRRVNHAWVVTDAGYVWEPQTKRYFSADTFSNTMKPITDASYTPEEAAIMAARAKNLGPWSGVPHSVGLRETLPPILYHGTSDKMAGIILHKGLKPMGVEKYTGPIWLTTSLRDAEDMAKEVSIRRGGQPVILTVDLPSSWPLETAETEGYITWTEVPARYIKRLKSNPKPKRNDEGEIDWSTKKKVVTQKKPAIPLGEFISYVVFLPVSYFASEGYKVPFNIITLDSVKYGQTSRLIASNIGFGDAAMKYIASIRNPLHGWKDVGFDAFMLQRQYYQDRTAIAFSVDEIIEQYVATFVGKPITPEFFERRTKDYRKL